MCVLTNKYYKAYLMRFSFSRLGHAPGVGLLAAGWDQKSNFSEQVHVAYQIEGYDEWNRI